MDFKVFIKSAALVTGFAGMIFAYQPNSMVGGTVPTWQDHKPAPGCKPYLKTTDGPELSFYHVGLAFGPGPGVTFTGTPITGPGKMVLNSDVKAYYLDKDLVIPAQCTISVAPGNWIYGGTYSKLDTMPRLLITLMLTAAPFSSWKAA